MISNISLFFDCLARSRINKANPELSIQFHYAPNKSIVADLLESKLDLGFLTIPPDIKLLETHKIGSEKLLVIIPKKSKVKFYEDLIKLGFINHPDGKEMLEKVFFFNFASQYKNFETIRISGGNNQIGRILEPVSMGFGFTILPHFAYDAFKDKNKLTVFPLKKLVTNDIYIVYKKHRILPARFKFIVQELTRKLKF